MDEQFWNHRKQINTIVMLKPWLTVEQAYDLYVSVPDLRGMVDAAVEMQDRISNVLQQVEIS